MKTSPDQLFEDPRGSRRKAPDLSFRITPAVAERMAQQLPQAIVKVLSYGYNLRSVRQQLGYISRYGDLELEDPEGDTLTKDEVAERVQAWKVDFEPQRKVSRESMHLMLSSPAGSNSKAVEEAARRFARDVFGENNDYLFATHTDTDNPHVHIVVKIRGYDGTKLHPGPADFRRWRGIYAHRLREVGVMVDATPRLARGVGEKALPSKLVQMVRKKNITPRVLEAADREAEHVALAEIDVSDTPWGAAMRRRTERYREALLSMAKRLLEQKGRRESLPDVVARSQKIEAFALAVPVPRTRLEADAAFYAEDYEIAALHRASRRKEEAKMPSRRSQDTYAGVRKEEKPTDIEPDFDP